MKDCTDHISLSGLAASYPGTAMPVKKIYYDADVSTTTTTDDLTNYFTFTDTGASQCGAVTCTLHDSGCLNAYSGGHVSIDASNNLVFDHNVALGWGLTTALVA